MWICEYVKSALRSHWDLHDNRSAGHLVCKTNVEKGGGRRQEGRIQHTTSVLCVSLSGGTPWLPWPLYRDVIHLPAPPNLPRDHTSFLHPPPYLSVLQPSSHTYTLSPVQVRGHRSTIPLAPLLHRPSSFPPLLVFVGCLLCPFIVTVTANTRTRTQTDLC